MVKATIGIAFSIWLITSVGCTGESEGEADSTDTTAVAQQSDAVDAMRNDLESMARAEEHYYSENQTYTTSLSTIGVEITPGVTLLISDADSTGWSATAQSEFTDATCALVFGRAAVAPALTQGEVGCTVD